MVRGIFEKTIIDIRGISKRFPGVLALEDVHLAFAKGEVHAIVGENGAGKSTLMNILAGELRPDAGEIRFNGQATTLSSPALSRKLGISVVYQELSLCHNMTVAENIMLPRSAGRSALSLLSRRRLRQGAYRALAKLEIDTLDLDCPVHRLTIAQMQMVEIARAISEQVRVLILDEPNSALSPRESAKLFEVVKQLRADGVTVIYVSHHLHEVLEIADRITVMRDGRTIETLTNSGVSEARLIDGMVGRAKGIMQREAVERRVGGGAGATVLEVEGMSSDPNIQTLSFALRRGEILGVGGLPDSGKDELADALFGLRPRHGIVRLNGQVVPSASTAAAIRAGMVLVPADRRGAGGLLNMSVAQNIVASSLPRFSFLGLQRRARIQREARAQVARLDARVTKLSQRLATLSGGNQQKIILGRALVTHPDVLILQEPTRGIDVGAKAEIYEILKGIAREGVGVLMITSEMLELILHSSRVIVMREGAIAGELEGPDITEQAVLERAIGTDQEAAE